MRLDAVDYSLSELQLAIMDVLWERQEATVLDIHDALRKERRIAQSTVATLLSRMQNKGVVSRRTEDRQHVFYATATREQVRRTVVSEFSELTGRLFSGDVAGLISQLITTREARPEDLARAREIIEQKERALREEEGK